MTQTLDDSLAILLRLAGGAVAEVLAGRSLSQVLPQIWRSRHDLAPGSRGTIQNYSYDTLRYLGETEAVLQALLKKPLTDPELHGLLLVALRELVRKPERDFVIVDQAVTAAAQISGGGAKGLVNAVLRSFQRDSAALLAAARASEPGRWQYPQWWIARMRRAYPDRWQTALENGNLHPPMTLRVNVRRTSVAAYLEKLTAVGFAARQIGVSAVVLETPVNVEDLPDFAIGHVSVQDAAAQHAAHLLDVVDGMRVLDACAAPGGKTAHILEIADVELDALDSDAPRLARVGENLKRLQLDGMRARTISADAAQPETWYSGVPYDRILLDAPCSASGVVRRHPDIKWLRRDADISKLAHTQAGMLDALWQALRRDGKLLYATCSVFPEENTRQIAAFLSRHPSARQLSLDGIPDPQLLPTPEHDGFFYALLEKTE